MCIRDRGRAIRFSEYLSQIKISVSLSNFLKTTPPADHMSGFNDPASWPIGILFNYNLLHLPNYQHIWKGILWRVCWLKKYHLDAFFLE